MERETERGDKMEREETIAVVYHPFLFYSESKLSPSYETERGGSMERETERGDWIKGGKTGVIEYQRETESGGGVWRKTDR